MFRIVRISGGTVGRLLLCQRREISASICLRFAHERKGKADRNSNDCERKSVKFDSFRQQSVLNSLVESEDASHTGQLTVAQKVVERGKDVSYFFIICVGFGVTGFLLWIILHEFFSSGSPSSVFRRALKKVKAHKQVRLVIGEDIAGYGDWSGRGRRKRINHQEYVVDGQNYMRVQFYIAGSQRNATVQADMKEVSRGQWEFRFLFVELEGYPPGVIVIEDNR